MGKTSVSGWWHTSISTNCKEKGFKDKKAILPDYPKKKTSGLFHFLVTAINLKNKQILNFCSDFVVIVWGFLGVRGGFFPQWAFAVIGWLSSLWNWQTLSLAAWFNTSVVIQLFTNNLFLNSLFFCLWINEKFFLVLYSFHVLQSSCVFLECPEVIVSRVFLRLHELRHINALQTYLVF